MAEKRTPVRRFFYRIPGGGEGRRPPAEYVRVVDDAIEKFCGIGRYERIGAGLILPPFTIVWDDPSLLPHQGGATGVHANGRVVIYLRTDVSLEQCHRTMIHEMAHCHDNIFFGSLPNRQDPVFEARAERMVQALAWL